MIFSIDAPAVVTEATQQALDDEGGEDVALLPLAGDRASFTARVGARTEARPRKPIRLSVDPGRFHFFDPETGETVGAARNGEVVEAARAPRA